MNSTNTFRATAPQKGGGGGMMAMGLVALILIGVAVWYFFFRPKKGCMTTGYKEYDVKYEEDTDPSACKTQQGCMKSGYTEYDVKYGEDTTPTACKTPIVSGCMNATATNKNPLANTPLPSACTFGCEDKDYIEFDTDAACVTPQFGEKLSAAILVWNGRQLDIENNGEGAQLDPDATQAWPSDWDDTETWHQTPDACKAKCLEYDDCEGITYDESSSNSPRCTLQGFAEMEVMGTPYGWTDEAVEPFSSYIRNR